MRYEDQQFADQRVHLDGNEYIRCRFDRCTLVFSASAPFDLQGNSFDAPRIELAGSAALTINVLVAMRNGGFAVQVDQLLEGIKQTPPPGTPRN